MASLEKSKGMKCFIIWGEIECIIKIISTVPTLMYTLKLQEQVSIRTSVSNMLFPSLLHERWFKRIFLGVAEPFLFFFEPSV